MNRCHFSGMLPVRILASSLLLAATAKAAFVWNETGAMIYDGTVDGTPYTVGSDPNGDVNITNGGSLTVLNGALNINPNTQWGDKIGHQGSGTVTVGANGVLNWTVDNDNEDRLMFGNGVAGNATVNLNGGDLNVVGPGGYDHAERNVRFGSDGASAMMNLNGGSFDVVIDIPVAVAGKWVSGGTMFENSTGATTFNITDGWFKVSGSGPFGVGDNGVVNFISGGQGGLSINGWTQSQFEELVTSGKIRKDGETASVLEFTYTQNGANGEYTVNNSDEVEPVIVAHPSNVSGYIGSGAAAFTASAIGLPMPGLLWEVSVDGGVSWTSTGVTTSTYTLPPLAYSMNGNQYRMTATNIAGVVTSNPATLTVSYPVATITSQPANQEGVDEEGGVAFFAVTAEGIGNLTYQWQRSFDGGSTWEDLAGETADFLGLESVTHSDAGLYRVVITDDAATGESPPLPATVTTSNWAYLSLANTTGAFIWNAATGTMNAATVYDGSEGGPDESINPFTQFSNDISIARGAETTGSLTVNGGTLTLVNKDQWAPKAGGGGTGVITVNGGTLNIYDTGSGSGAANSEQRFTVGNGSNGSLVLNGGDVNIAVGAGTDAARGFRIGVGGSASTTGLVNLISGTLTYSSSARIALGTEAAAGIIRVQGGHLVVTGTSELATGTNDYINFISGGAGSVSILGWDSVTDPDYTRFKELIDDGRIRVDGIVQAAGDYSRFLFSDDPASDEGAKRGMLQLDNTNFIPPFFAGPPAPQFPAVAIGQTVTLTVTASGNPAPSLQWVVSTDGGFTIEEIPGATSDSYTTPPVTAGMDGYIYGVIADNGLGAPVESDFAMLEVVYPEPTITQQPVSVTNVVSGGSASLSVTATGVGAITYQWQKSLDAGNTWPDVPGATAATLSFDPVQHSDAALYRCVITDPAALEAGGEAKTATSHWVYLSLANDSEGFVWTPANSTMVYDGAGADAGINPYSQFGDDIAIGLGNGNSSVLTVSSGTLSIFNVDQWSMKIGQNHTNGHTGNGTVNVEAGATLNLGDTGAGGAIGSTQQRVVIGARANASLNVNGGTVNVHVGPGTDTARSFMIGGSAEAGYTGTLNLNAGTLNYGSSAPVSLGTGAGTGLINVVDGHLLVTGTSSLQTGTNDFINFSSGGTGSIAFLGWAASDHANFKALIDAGRIQINGNIVAAGNYGAFIFTADGDLGVMRVDPEGGSSSYGSWADANAGGQGPELDFDSDGVKNGIEYFMGSEAGFTANPGIDDNGTITWPNGGNIPHTAYGADGQYLVQTSGDLVEWDDVEVNDENLEITGSHVSYTLSPGGGKLFVRLVVTPE